MLEYIQDNEDKFSQEIKNKYVGANNANENSANLYYKLKSLSDSNK